MDTTLFDKIYGGDIGEPFGDNKDSKYSKYLEDEYTYGGDVEEIINIIAGYMSSDDEESISGGDDEESNVIIGLAENNFDDLLKSLGGDEDDNKSDDTFTFEMSDSVEYHNQDEETVIDFNNIDVSPKTEKLDNDNDNTYGAAETITLNKKDFLNYIKKILTYSN
jgi:hypothetical protein